MFAVFLLAIENKNTLYCIKSRDFMVSSKAGSAADDPDLSGNVLDHSN